MAISDFVYTLASTNMYVTIRSPMSSIMDLTGLELSELFALVVEPACGERDIVTTTTCQVYVHACVGLCMCLSGFVRTITMDGFQNNLAQLFYLTVVLQILERKCYKNIKKKSSLYSQSLLIFIHKTPVAENHPTTREIRDLLWPRVYTDRKRGLFLHVHLAHLQTGKTQTRLQT